MARNLMHISLFLRFIIPILAWDYIFERGESANDLNAGQILFDVQVERLNRSDYELTGNVTFRSPFMRTPNTYYHSMSFLISPSETKQYEKMPIHFPRISYCEHQSRSYRKYVMRSASDSPFSDDQNDHLCREFQSNQDLNFYIYKYVIDKSAVPPNISDGLVKIETLFELDDSVIGMTLVVRAENESESRRNV